MTEIKITTQQELDALDIEFNGKIIITGNIDLIDKHYKNAEVHICENAIVKVINGSAQITDVYGSAQITYVYGSANVLFIDEQATVKTSGSNILSYYYDKNVSLETSNNTTIVKLERQTDSWEKYKSMYPVKISGDKAIMYKSVRKLADGKYVSNHDSKFEYRMGESVTEKCDTNTKEDCSYGIHISHKMWAISFGRDWDNMALLEVEVDVNTIVIPDNCDGKVRTTEIKVIREIPKDEWYN